MVVVGRFSFPIEAYVAKASLESAGIDAFVADEHTVNMQWLYSNAMGGVRLMVADTDEDAARALLAEDFSDSVVEAAALDADTSDSMSNPETCPECHGESVEPFTKGKKPAFLVFVLLGFPLFFYKHGLKCQRCGHFFTA